MQRRTFLGASFALTASGFWLRNSAILQAEGIPYALKYTAATSVITVPSAADISDLSMLTLRVVARLEAGGSNTGSLVTKQDGTPTPVRLRFRRAGGTNLAFIRERATVSCLYQTNNAPIVNGGALHDIWVTFNINAAAGQVVHLYVGVNQAPPMECTYSSAGDGSGSLVSESGDPLRLGSFGTAGNDMRGSAFLFQLWGRVVPYAEILQRANRLFIAESEMLGSWVAAANGTGPVIDRSGRNHTGTITGTVTSDYLPYASER